MQDTRPLMAAMGAQAATQIEGNRMMTETMQKGMQGIENFAARRQLAATRAQLGALDLEDPDYGQKLAGLVLDNPLAFTNAKTAPLADMAFKQASNTYLAKEKNKADSLARYQEYRYGIDAINAKMQGQSSLMDKEYSRMAADTFRAESSAAVAEIKRIDQAILENKDSRFLPFLQSEKARAESAFTGVKKKYEDTVNRTRQSNVASYSGPMEYAPLPEDGGVPMDGAIVSPNLSDQQNLDASLIPNAIEGPNTPPFLPDYENRPPLMSAISSEESRPAVAPISPSDIQYGEPMPSVEAPVIPSAPVTPAGAVAPSAAQTSGVYTPEQIAESRRAYEESLREPSSTSRSGKMTQSQIDNLVNRNPDVVEAKLNEGMLGLEYMDAEIDLKKAEDSGNEEAIAKAEQFRASVSQALEFAKINAKSREASTAITASSFESPQEYLNYEQALLAKREAEAQKSPSADQQADDNFLAATGAAGTTTVTPAAPPAPMNDMAKSFAKIEAPRRAAEANVIPETNQQWTDVKNLAIEALGGMEKVVQLTDEIYQNNVLGLSLPADRLRLTMAIKDKLLFGPDKKVKGGSFSLGGAGSGVKILVGPDKKVKGFEQKSERSGVETVSVGEIAAALADDIIRAREAGIAGSIPKTPEPFVPKTTGASFKSIPQ